MRHDTCACAALIFAALALPACALATDGDVDTTFGVGGFAFMEGVDAPTPGIPRPLVQPDGKIVFCTSLLAAGSGLDFFIMRLDPDGSFDTTFNFDGKVTIDFDGGADECNNLALQDDGKIVAVGTSHGLDAISTTEFAAVRLNADGSLDATFGGGTGKTTVAFDLGGDDADSALAVAMQPDGKIVVAGSAHTDMNGSVIAVARLLTDGSRDTGFNASGRVTIPFDLPPPDASNASAFSVAIDDAGRIVLAGQAVDAQLYYDCAFARLLPDGTLDDTFDADGRVTIPFHLGASNASGADQAILERDGKIVMAGFADAGSGSTTNMDVALARLQEDGSLDPAFGIGGRAVVPFDIGGNQNDFGWGVVEDEAGRLSVVGVAAFNGTSQGVIVARVRHDGTLDPGFGVLGKKSIAIDGDYAVATGVALQGTQIILAGQRWIGSGIDDFVARLEVDLLFADGFE